MSMPKKSRLPFAHALRAVRLIRGIAQEEMEPAASRVYMTQLETGKQSPTLDMIEALAQRLNVHPATLVALSFVLMRPPGKRKDTLKQINEEISKLLEDADDVKQQRRLPRRKQP
jgi:transcriptional regulator with XRE-family HTH domain